MHLLRVFCISALFFFKISANADLPSNYTELPAETKLTILWNKIEETRWSELPAYNDKGWSSIVTRLRSVFTLYKTFDHQSDEIPSGREKLIHTYGTTAKIAFVPVPNAYNYTGIYKTGAIGLARLSLAASPETAAYTPGMALKFLVDENNSLNLQAMYSLEGQADNWNFFENSFSTTISNPTSFAIKLGAFLFSLVQNPPNVLPVHHLAETDRFGRPISNEITPTLLVFKPSTEVKNLYPEGLKVDPRVFLATALNAGTKLYDVFSIENEQEILIGYLELLSPFIASEYGDHVLFFQHQRFRN